MSRQNEMSAAFHLYKSWVGWRVPEYATITDHTASEFGMAMHDDQKKANAILLNKKFVQATTADIAEYASKGGALDINDPNDAIKVYGWLMEHLADWLDHMENPQLIKRTVPIDGLRKFNRLANILFPVANRYGYYKKPALTMADRVMAIFQGHHDPEQQTHRFNDTIMRRIELAYRRNGGR
ncbi:MAG: hypothetical protein ACRDBQ_18680 [Shewanella sp.]